MRWMSYISKIEKSDPAAAQRYQNPFTTSAEWDPRAQCFQAQQGKMDVSAAGFLANMFDGSPNLQMQHLA